jgi:hypothetical protein
MDQLLSYFQKEQIVCDQGRFGFATRLKEQGPLFIRSMPRGYLVELVQLLLNRGVLSFQKGTISLPTSIPFISETKDFINFNVGPLLSREIRMAITRLIRYNPSLGLKITNDPMSVLHCLCSHAALPLTGKGGVLRRIPVYHFERYGPFHQPEWVSFVRVEMAGLPMDSKGRVTWYQEYKAKKEKKEMAQQAVSLQLLEKQYWKLAFNVCMGSLLLLFREKEEKKMDPPGLLIKERKAMFHALLTSSFDKDSAPDATFRLDRLLLILDQKSCVYQCEPQNNKTILHFVDINIRPRPHLFHYNFKKSGTFKNYLEISVQGQPTSVKTATEGKEKLAQDILMEIRIHHFHSPISFDLPLSTTSVLPWRSSRLEEMKGSYPLIRGSKIF